MDDIESIVDEPGPDALPLIYQLSHRNYDPVAGRFLTPDPIEDDQNTYRFARNNPVNLEDPTGLAASTFVNSGAANAAATTTPWWDMTSGLTLQTNSANVGSAYSLTPLTSFADQLTLSSTASLMQTASAPTPSFLGLPSFMGYSTENLAALPQGVSPQWNVDQNVTLALPHGDYVQPSSPFKLMSSVFNSTPAAGQVAGFDFGTGGTSSFVDYIDMFFGGEAHKLIAKQYMDINDIQRYANYTPIGIIAAELSGNPNVLTEKEAAGKPDILNSSLNTSQIHDLYEIKPDDAFGLAWALKQGSNYVNYLNKADVPTAFGSSTNAGVSGVIPFGDWELQYHSPQPGVILYHWATASPVRMAPPLKQPPLMDQLEFAAWYRIFNPPLGLKSGMAFTEGGRARTEEIEKLAEGFRNVGLGIFMGGALAPVPVPVPIPVPVPVP
jgi:hypothetical protein